MRIMKIVSVILAVTLFTLCFSACGKQKVKNDNSATETSTQTSTTEGGVKKAEPYVTLKKTDTGFGLITIPEINEKKLNKESAVMANKMFADIRDNILQDIEEYKANDKGTLSKEDQKSSPCTVKTAVVGTTLSVLVKYNYFLSEPKNDCVAVNFDTKTGDVINPRDVVKSAGFTEDEVKAALRCFADRNLFDEWEHTAFDEIAEKKSLPDGWGDPSYGWQDTLDDMVRDYDSEPNPLGTEWDELLCHPTVFVDENKSLFVGANIPTSAGEGFWATMVQIGHSDSQTLHLNPNNPFGEKYSTTGAMTLDSALESVAFTMGLDKDNKDSNGVKYKIQAEYVDNIKSDDGVIYPAFIINVSNKKDKKAVDKYAVGVFTGTVCKYDTATDNWSLCPNNSGNLPENIFTGMKQDRIIAAVYNEPSDLEEWSVSVADEVDLVAYDTGKNYYESESDTALIFAKNDDTKFIFMSGKMDGSEFRKQTELYSVTLNSGECILVHMLRPNDSPSQAIIVESENDTGCNSGTYLVQHNSQGTNEKTEYISIS